jgi:preprotein translocase subunit YajC
MRSRERQQNIHKEFENGSKVTTPGGEGIVSKVADKKITVRLASGEERDFTADQVTDDSDAG